MTSRNRALNLLHLPTPNIANFGTKIFILSKVYTDEGGVKHDYMYHGLSAKSECIISRTGGQTVV